MGTDQDDTLPIGQGNEVRDWARIVNAIKLCFPDSIAWRITGHEFRADARNLTFFRCPMDNVLWLDSSNPDMFEKSIGSLRYADVNDIQPLATALRDTYRHLDATGQLARFSESDLNSLYRA